MSGVVKEQAFIVRRGARRAGPVRLRQICTLTCNPHPGIYAIHVDVQPLRPSLGRHLHQCVLHVDVQTDHPTSPALLRRTTLRVDVQPLGPSLCRYHRQRVLHVDVHSVAAHAVGGLHVDVQSPFSLSWITRSDGSLTTRKRLHVNVQRLRSKRQRWAGTLSPHSKQNASRQLRPRQNLGLSHFGVWK